MLHYFPSGIRQRFRADAAEREQIEQGIVEIAKELADLKRQLAVDKAIVDMCRKCFGNSVAPFIPHHYLFSHCPADKITPDLTA